MTIAALWVVLLAIPPLADDIPAGTDVALRVSVGELAAEATAAAQELRALAGSWPQLDLLLRPLAGMTLATWREAARLCGVDVAGKGVVATVLADLDAAGGRVLAVIVRGGSPRAPAPSEAVEQRTVDEIAAHVLAGSGVACAVVRDVLVLGDERGLLRGIRHVRGGAPPARGRDPASLSRLARRERREAPFMAAFELPPTLRRDVAFRSRPFERLAGAVAAGTVSARPGRVEAWLTTRAAAERAPVAAGLRALVAALNAGGQGLLAAGEITGALGAGASQARLLPPGIDAAVFAPAVTRWLAGFHLTPAVRVRPGGVEARIEVSSYRGLAAAALVLAAAWPGAASGAPPAAEKSAAVEDELRAQAESLLFELRDAELAYRELTGAPRACGPHPRALPRQPGAWTADACFAELGYAPEVGDTLMQLEAQLAGGRLTLVARADPDGDGVPQVWTLDETADEVQEGGAPDAAK